MKNSPRKKEGDDKSPPWNFPQTLVGFWKIKFTGGGGKMQKLGQILCMLAKMNGK